MRNIEGIPAIKQVKREVYKETAKPDQKRPFYRDKPTTKAALLVRAHDGDIDYVPAPIAIKCSRRRPE